MSLFRPISGALVLACAALGAPATAFQYDWNLLPIGQQLWLQHLLTYEKFPPLQAPESYNLSGILDEVKKAHSRAASD
ncbi:hypothetical protein [Bradyrhizobium sp. Leo121]|uniref:hypothetical protein n=1 Tax=Bradyrhizobium sp. Leo121 TaxID=1571195 RepID=UPI001029080E